MEKNDYLAILKESAEAWNAWREKNPDFTPDLSLADLNRAKLRGVNLKKAFMPRAVFLEAYLRESCFEGANLERAMFRMADLGSSNLRSANLYKANFRRADLWKADLSAANLKAADLGKAILHDANFEGASLELANLQHANLKGANLQSANLRGANFQGAQLEGANFSNADLANAVFDMGAIDLKTLAQKAAEREAAPAATPPGFTPPDTEPDKCPAPSGEIEVTTGEEAARKGADLRKKPSGDISIPAIPAKEKPPSAERPESPVPAAAEPLKKNEDLYGKPTGKEYEQGTVFGTYELRTKIARGGMGVVYSAFDRSLHRDVAIKFISSELREDPEYLMRFLQEARVTAQMDHPNIINIYGIGQEKGEVYVAMQLIKGRNISQMLKEKGVFTFMEALFVGRCVASALAYAHERGLIHRDVKPDNIMVDENRRVRVMDFGIARDLSLKKRITQEGHFMGTIHYSAPEQWSSDIPDPRSDIYALGVVLYEMITGRLPYDADSPMNLMYKIIHDDPVAVRDLRPDIPAEIEQILEKMLAKDFEKRYFQAEQVVQDIDRIMEKRDLMPKDQEDLIGLADLNTLFKDKISTDSIDTPTKLVLMMEDLEFATKGRKKFLKQGELYSRKLGTGLFYVLFRETIYHDLEMGNEGSRFPLLAGARKGKTLGDDEVAVLIEELEQVEKGLEQLPLTEIWTLSVDMKSRGTFSRKIQKDELMRFVNDTYGAAREFKSIREFFEPILSSYRDVCRKALENKSGAFWK
jgi:serine/threonine protein kinase